MATFKNLRCNHCPYCRGKNNYLPVVNGLKKLHIGVHVTSYEEVEKYSSLNRLIEILTQGFTTAFHKESQVTI